MARILPYLLKVKLLASLIKDIRMDTLQLSKNDFKLLLIATALIPVLCFVSGLYTANSFAYSEVNDEKAVSMSLAKETAAVTEKTDMSEQPEPLQGSSDISLTPVVSTVNVVSEANLIPLTSPRYVVQAGIFSTYKNAVEYQTTLRINGLETQITDHLKNANPIYRVILDSFDSKDDALKYLASIEEKYGLALYIAQINSKDYATKVAVL